MEIYIWSAVLILMGLGIGFLVLNFRRKPPRRVKGQGEHRPHAPGQTSADARQLQNGGGAGPGATGGGSDFGP
ncbi:hypothetical protein [Aliiroseovarius crassostreae]|uniref:hypothetical protein n=1 Tax=Aliiroseovarius crassostreae TaxID=154981 RepID=UPI003C7E8423